MKISIIFFKVSLKLNVKEREEKKGKYAKKEEGSLQEGKMGGRKGRSRNRRGSEGGRKEGKEWAQMKQKDEASQGNSLCPSGLKNLSCLGKP